MIWRIKGFPGAAVTLDGPAVKSVFFLLPAVSVAMLDGVNVFITLCCMDL